MKGDTFYSVLLNCTTTVPSSVLHINKYAPFVGCETYIEFELK